MHLFLAAFPCCSFWSTLGDNKKEKLSCAGFRPFFGPNSAPWQALADLQEDQSYTDNMYVHFQINQSSDVHMHVVVSALYSYTVGRHGCSLLTTLYTTCSVIHGGCLSN